MLVDLILFAIFAAIGLRLQVRSGSDSDQLRERLWTVNFSGLIPAAAIYTFLTIDLTGHLLMVAGCAAAAWWSTIGVAFVYARLVAKSRAQQGALLMAASFPNTGFIGFPLATLAFGTDGLRGAVVFDQVGLVVPAIVVSNLIAAHFARTRGDVSDAAATVGEPRDAAARRSLMRDLFVNPPLWAMLGALAVRATFAHHPVGNLEWLGTAVKHAVGPMGFLLLGLSLPLERLSHTGGELARAAGTITIRLLIAPLMLFVWARAAGVHVPPVFYLVTGMPTAFHVLIITRLYNLEPPLIRLIVVTCTVISVTGVVTGVAVLR